ncbi:hypothetical protein CLOM_g13435 [Closterium sp. NIES-68]|nr:hypothetical protein CLOM_g13435 [Closterium sp. NIES-68]GJP72450.1 hypothetical protein CLOP_g3182 [Closterium sp. NIES-67]
MKASSAFGEDLAPPSSSPPLTFRRPPDFESLHLDVPESTPPLSPSTSVPLPSDTPAADTGGSGGRGGSASKAQACDGARLFSREWRPATPTVVRSPNAALVSHLAVASAVMDREWAEDESPARESLPSNDFESPWFWAANRGRREAKRWSSDSERPVAVRDKTSPTNSLQRRTTVPRASQPDWDSMTSCQQKPLSNGHGGPDSATRSTQGPQCMCFPDYTGCHRRTCSLQARPSGNRDSFFEATSLRRRSSLDGEKGLVSCVVGSPRSRGSCGIPGVRHVSFNRMVHVRYIGVMESGSSVRNSAYFAGSSWQDGDQGHCMTDNASAGETMLDGDQEGAESMPRRWQSGTESCPAMLSAQPTNDPNGLLTGYMVPHFKKALAPEPSPTESKKPMQELMEQAGCSSTASPVPSRSLIEGPGSKRNPSNDFSKNLPYVIPSPLKCGLFGTRACIGSYIS